MRHEGERSGRATGRGRVLLVLLAGVGAIAVGGGAAGVVFGAVTGPEPQQVAVSTSSEYRFLSGAWFALGLLLWRSLRRPVPRAASTRVVLIAAIGGGLGRLVSLVADGSPGPFVVALVIELVVLPLLLAWHVRAFPAGIPS